MSKGDYRTYDGHKPIDARGGQAMLGTTLHWVNGPWIGRIALAARPRGGEWIADEMDAWSASGIDTVVSLLELQEEQELDLRAESTEARAHGMTFRSLPIGDRQVPESVQQVTKSLALVEDELDRGRNVVLHCRQGVGRTGLVAACLLLMKGYEAAAAVKMLTEARGIEVPETAEQRRWLDRYAETLAAVR